MKTTLFYFSGRAGDLPTALLAHATASLAEQNRKTAKLLSRPLHTIAHLVAAAKYGDGPRNAEMRSHHVRQIIMRGNF